MWILFVPAKHRFSLPIILLYPDATRLSLSTPILLSRLKLANSAKNLYSGCNGILRFFMNLIFGITLNIIQNCT